MAPQRPHIPDHIRQQVEEEALNRCGYCLTARRFTAKRLHIEHIIPIAAGGGSDIQNLWLACDLCNSYKGARTHAVDPLTNQTVPLYTI
jgi:5-methylcytosine-specific restriction endonuclease McrA